MIRFGTGGWRDIIGENFTFDNVRRFSQGVANQIIESGKEEASVVIGYDNRFMAEEFAKASTEVFAGNNIKVILLTPAVPTPLVNYATKQENAAAGLTFTASHNPYIYNGIKYIREGGLPATEAVTSRMEEEINVIQMNEVKLLKYNQALTSRLVKRKNYDNDFITFVESQLNMDLIKESNIKVLYDPMFGTGVNSLLTLLVDSRTEVKMIHDTADPLFGGRVPAPTEATLWRLTGMMKEENYDIGIATDGDGDRIAIIDETSSYVDANEILTILYYYLMEYKGIRGNVVRNISTTHLLDVIAKHYGYSCFEKPVGFKHIAEGMLETNAILGGESSGGITIKGHLLEKDAILSAGILLEMLAVTKKPLSEIRQEIDSKFGFRYSKDYNYVYETELKQQIKTIITNIPSAKIYDGELCQHKTYDGVKWEWTDGTWCLVRFSGTEPLLRIMTESPKPSEVDSIIKRVLAVVEENLQY
ncbi:phosphoglucomutase/phosphomannomutase family protein [Virgibacillus halodenitrificans]|uniref:phosphoglucomutase/phosphomannomutase family protein n=1 Tax=Virgibacillus halodenitrificans TaxID=1482 RepID=UPI00136A08E8|nr:phosphoglucomutase/phosphomannomutase family protein [Virgibacillus halodenitrificans]MYL45157.1 phosphoglucomutase/phosphomannomutase family protein [Virgibacillus halodenitrificans]